MRKSLVFNVLLGLLMQNVHSKTFNGENEASGFFSFLESSAEKYLEIDPGENSLDAFLADVEKRYGETIASLRMLNRQITQKRQALDKIRQDIQSYQRQLDKESKELEDQIKSAYMMGQQEQLKLMLNQKDPALSSRMMVYYNYINKKRLAKLAAIQEAVKHLDELDKQRQAEADALEKQLKQKQSEQIVLDDFRKQRDKLLNDPANLQQLDQLPISENKLKNLLASLASPQGGFTADPAQDTESAKFTEEQTEIAEDFPKLEGDFSTLKGKLPWPVKGKSAKKILDLQASNIFDGVLIDAKEGAQVHAVTGGKVAFSDWLKGLGLLMIIKHDKDYMTLYAFNESLYKREGETVEAGEVIASVGKSGGRSQSGLYFGIRVQGRPVDPLAWCKH